MRSSTAVRSAAAPATTTPPAPAPTCRPIEGATKATFVARVADIGKYYQARVVATNTSSVAAVSSTSAQVQSAPIVLTHSSVGGRAKVGATIVATAGTWTAIPSATLSYQFFSCPRAISASALTVPNTCSALGSPAASPSIALPASAKGRFVTAKVTATNAIGSTSEYTPTTGAVADDPLVPKVTGTEQVARTLNVTPGVWTGTTTPVHLTRTGKLYAGIPILGVQDALRADGYGTPLTGNYDARTIADVKRFQVRHRVPNPDGYVGEMTWKAMRALTVSTTPTFTYQWMRCAASVSVTATTAPTASPFLCSAITRATDSTYQPVVADRGKFLVVQVTATGVRETPKVRWSLSTGAIQ